LEYTLKETRISIDVSKSKFTQKLVRGQTYELPIMNLQNNNAEEIFVKLAG